MIIRSQDKKKILNLEQIRKIDCETNSVMADDISVMGIYSTEEKAIEVLDRIAKKYSRYQCLKACGRISEEDAIFQMPSDEEVRA